MPVHILNFTTVWLFVQLPEKASRTGRGARTHVCGGQCAPPKFPRGRYFKAQLAFLKSVCMHTCIQPAFTSCNRSPLVGNLLCTPRVSREASAAETCLLTRSSAIGPYRFAQHHISGPHVSVQQQEERGGRGTGGRRKKQRQQEGERERG